MPEPRTGPRLSAYYAALFFLVGIYMPYWPVFLKGRGAGPILVGALLALSPWARAFLGPVAGAMADRRSPARMLAGASLLLAIAFSAFLPHLGLAGLVGVSLVASFVFAPVVPLADGLALREQRAGRLDYGRARLWGSLGFIAATVAGGRLLQGAPSDRVLVVIIATASVLALASLLLPGPAKGPASTAAPTDATPPTPGPWYAGLREVLATPGFPRFLAAIAFLHASHSVLYGFGTLYWQRLEIPETTIGLLWAEGVVVEVALFAVGARVARRLGARGLLVLAGIGGLVRWTILALATTVPWLAVAQVCHALTFAALHLGAMTHVATAVPDERTNSATTLYSALGGGLAMGVGMPIAGALYGAFGGAAFWMATGCAAVGLGIALSLRDSRTPLSQVDAAPVG